MQAFVTAQQAVAVLILRFAYSPSTHLPSSDTRFLYYAMLFSTCFSFWLVVLQIPNLFIPYVWSIQMEYQALSVMSSYISYLFLLHENHIKVNIWLVISSKINFFQINFLTSQIMQKIIMTSMSWFTFDLVKETEFYGSSFLV